MSRFRKHGRKYEIGCHLCGSFVRGDRIGDHERHCRDGKKRIIEAAEDRSPAAPEAAEIPEQPEAED
jgi:hypothetical protein